jgi:hypothetical protein
MATFPFFSDSSDGVLLLQRERERAGASKVSSRRWGEADGSEWRPTKGLSARLGVFIWWRGLGLSWSLVENDWARQAVVWDDVVHQVQ